MVFLARKNRACTQPPARAPISNLIFLKKEAPPRTLYSVHILKHDRLQRAAIMYYAFAIVKRVRAPLRVRHSSAKWTRLVRTRVHTRLLVRVCVCVCICVHFLQGEKKRRERKKKKRRRKDCSDDAVTVAFPKLLFPTFFLSFLSLFHSVQRGVGATRRSAFRGEKFRVSVGTRAEFAGLSRLIREGIRKRAE